MITDKMAEKLGNKKWRTRDGTVVLWKDMEVRHLRNSAAMVRRNAEQQENAAWQLSCMVQGDGAEYAAECAINQAAHDTDRANARAKIMEAYADWRAVHPDLPENVFYV